MNSVWFVWIEDASFQDDIHKIYSTFEKADVGSNKEMLELHNRRFHTSLSYEEVADWGEIEAELNTQQIYILLKEVTIDEDD